jgi:t-SNARE complex subunit (syntaxin)
VEKQELIEKLRTAYQVLSDIGSFESQIKNLSNGITHAKRDMMIKPKSKKTWALILGIIFAIPIFIMLIIMIVFMLCRSKWEIAFLQVFL